jgi:hypothetical protein
MQSSGAAPPPPAGFGARLRAAFRRRPGRSADTTPPEAPPAPEHPLARYFAATGAGSTALRDRLLARARTL